MRRMGPCEAVWLWHKGGKWWLPAQCYVMAGQMCEGRTSMAMYHHLTSHKKYSGRLWQQQHVSINSLVRQVFLDTVPVSIIGHMTLVSQGLHVPCEHGGFVSMEHKISRLTLPGLGVFYIHDVTRRTASTMSDVRVFPPDVRFGMPPKNTTSCNGGSGR